MKNMFLFSGQGSQYPMMGKELLESNPEFSFIYDTASEILGFDLKKICFESDEKTLARTIYSQPAIMATSLLCFETARKNGIEFCGVGGHSLGEYAAMVASGVCTLENRNIIALLLCFFQLFVAHLAESVKIVLCTG